MLVSHWLQRGGGSGRRRSGMPANAARLLFTPPTTLRRPCSFNYTVIMLLARRTGCRRPLASFALAWHLIMQTQRWGIPPSAAAACSMQRPAGGFEAAAATCLQHC